MFCEGLLHVHLRRMHVLLLLNGIFSVSVRSSLIYGVQVSWFLIDNLCRYCIYYWIWGQFNSIHFSSVAQSYQTFCDPIDCSTPDFLVHHQIPELTQTHVHWVSDAIQPSHPLSSPSPPTFNLSQHQGLFQWVSSSHQMARVLEFQLQHQSFQWILKTLISFRMDWSDLLAVQGTLKRLLQHHSSKASILWHSAFFIV